ncbi:arginine--tRNA ligase [Terriglobus roseus]|uniref:arginine--tRNA ligase n=1 Tax=Terriglobus roseus TaxID=392734 RepID=A0A1G7JNK2_9BACT|nr:arginine--tRNA ligase [Terriglobus roseus]SDF26493.1 arginyl-tRNA synthetase [Terriglobus roseus]
MYRKLKQALLETTANVLQTKYEVTGANIATELPPNIAMGEIATPVAFELAKRLRKAPKMIATELAAELNGIDGVATVEVAGAGYLNVKLDRAAITKRIAKGEHSDIGGEGLRLVEHTSINPNKAAHVGHLRNAILGDSFARLLRKDSYKSGYPTVVQNYIDNTGVQVADVVVGLLHLEGKSSADVDALIGDLVARGERVDYYLWDLYARVSQWYDSDADQKEARKKLRLDTLHHIEEGNNEIAKVADLVATAVLERHLETMERLSIEYDFLPRESEILHLHFWEAARQLMVERGVLYLETEGKNKGCWVMRRPGAEVVEGPDEDAKVIIRSNGTVTYVGKDIAYHLWKFGLLPGRDFGYKIFREYETHPCWISTMHGEEPHPNYGQAAAIYNVIDSRQNDPQANVVESLRALGYTEAAANYTHINYAMVALTPRCAIDLGYTLSDADKEKTHLEVSGRKGFGVKADDLLDRLIAAAKSEVDARHPEDPESQRQRSAEQIAVGALRYFMLKYTRNTIIAFDFRDALSFEGETGPYVQYSAVRAANILKKAGVTEQHAINDIADLDLAPYFEGEAGDSLWAMWLILSRVTTIVEQSIAAAEPAIVARFAFQLAQEFNNFYHRNHVLNETDPARKKLLLATAAVASRELTRVLGWLGIEVPLSM